MHKRAIPLALVAALVFSSAAWAQVSPWTQWTLLPLEIVDEIVGEASGEAAWNSVVELAGYDKNRPITEYADTFYETRYVYETLRRYGLAGAEIVRYPAGRTWNGIRGDLWEVSPRREKISSFRDQKTMLAKGSNSADVTAELVWVGRGTREELDRVEVRGKIVVTEGSIGSVHRLACLEMGAEGVLAISTSRPYFDPQQIPFSSVSGDASRNLPAKFGFFITAREGEYLKRRLLAGQQITAHALVETSMEPIDLQNVVCHIPGSNPAAGEVIFSAHLFEGYTKQGANDNGSGSAAILEVARVLHTLIEEGRIPRPERTIRFLWGPEFSGTGPWVAAHTDLMRNTLCNINLDMVGEWLSLNKGFFQLMRTTYGNPHYVNDVMENYYRYVGEASRERVQMRSGFDKVPRRIVAPMGADEPMYYSIETNYGSSDHEVFNDPGVQVPGVMMIVWPDQWYHTSGDRPDKTDPTQMRRAVVIAAAGAYTIGLADDEMAVRIASETAANGARRLGYQFQLGMVELDGAESTTLAVSYRRARNFVETAVLNEKNTLATIEQLAADKRRINSHIAEMQKMVEAAGRVHLAALEVQMRAAAGRLGTQPVRLQPTDLERRAGRLVPRQTELLRTGYRLWQGQLNQVSAAERARFPVPGGSIANTTELLRLINGSHSALDIKNMLDAQYQRESDLQAVLNHLEILKLAGLVTF